MSTAGLRKLFGRYLWFYLCQRRQVRRARGFSIKFHIEVVGASDRLTTDYLEDDEEGTKMQYERLRNPSRNNE